LEGRGRFGRRWVAPPGSSLLVSILLRPHAAEAAAVPMAAAVAMAEAASGAIGTEEPVRIKWPNDLVHRGDEASPDRKVAGVLAEADWPPQANIAAGWQEAGPRERVVVVVGIGVNVNWPALSTGAHEWADTATALNLIAGRELDREVLLAAYLVGLEALYAPLVEGGDRTEVVRRWRALSATAGRHVRVDLGAAVVEGRAVDLTEDGRLVVDTVDGERRVLLAGDVVHLRPT
jgi:BirA family biotin operon repressor/biotin-[acetyl-CoA-carboxylase] ligase